MACSWKIDFKVSYVANFLPVNGFQRTYMKFNFVNLNLTK